MYKASNGKCYYKVGLHIHTNLSDGAVSPEQMAEIYRAAGFDAVAITDHWVYHPQDEIGGLTILSGCEYNIDFGIRDTADGIMHIVGIGMKTKPELDEKTARRQQVIDAINACGGMAVLAHPYWSLNTKEDVEALHGFSLLEIYNSVSDVHQSVRPYSGYLVDVLANDGYVLPLIATDDTHYYDGTDDAKSFLMVEAESGSAEDILSGIRASRFYASQGPELYVKQTGEGERTISVRCSPCSLISFVTNASWSKNRVFRGENLTSAEYTMQDFDKWVRIEIKDAEGRFAWSNVITFFSNR